MQNFAIDVLESAARRPDAIALLAPDQTMTYGALRVRIIRYALHMRLRGIGRRSLVALDANRMPEGPALALALALLGARWVEMKPTINPVALGVTHALSVNSAGGPNSYLVDARWTEHPAGLSPSEPIGFEGFESENDVAFYVESSGTTGRPKLIERSYGYTHASIERMRQAGLARVYVRFPPLSSAGLHFRIAALIEGATVIVRNSNFQDLLGDKVDMVLASPAQVDAMLEGATPGALRVPRLLAWGAQMPPRLVRHWLQYFAEVELGYGSREASAVGRMKVREMPDDAVVEYALAPGAQVEIVDDAGRRCPANAVGTVRIRTTQQASGYVGAPDASEKAFRDGWFYPGDLGLLTRDGKLRIQGRIADQFNFGGVKANAGDIDETAMHAPGVKRAVSFAQPNERGVDELGVAVVIAADVPPATAAQAIRQACQTILGVALVPKAIYVVESLPLNESGKEARAAMRELCAGRPRY